MHRFLSALVDVFLVAVAVGFASLCIVTIGAVVGLPFSLYLARYEANGLTTFATLASLTGLMASVWTNAWLADARLHRFSDTKPNGRPEAATYRTLREVMPKTIPSAPPAGGAAVAYVFGVALAVGFNAGTAWSADMRLRSAESAVPPMIALVTFVAASALLRRTVAR